MAITMTFAMAAANVQAANPADTFNNTSEEDRIQKIAEAYNAEQTDERSKIVCKKEAEVGTRFKKTVCRSMATIEAEREHAKRSLHRMRTFTSNN